MHSLNYIILTVKPSKNKPVVVCRFLVLFLTLCCVFLGISHRHLSDHLSELVENTLKDLENSKVMVFPNLFTLSPNPIVDALFARPMFLMN